MRRLLGRLLADRRVVGGFFLVVQLVAVMYGLDWISERWQWVPYVLNVLSFSIVIWLVRKYDNPNYKIAWIIIILLLPLFMIPMSYISLAALLHPKAEWKPIAHSRSKSVTDMAGLR